MNTHSCGAVIVPGQVICSGCLASLLDAPIGPQPPAAEPFQPAPPSSSTPSFAPLSPRVEEPSVSAAAGPRRLRHPEGWCSGPSNLTATTCDVCGTPIAEVSFADSSLQYCPGCQTGGKPLADRRMSKLLK